MPFETVWNQHPKEYGKGSRRCRVCSNQGGLIRKYGMNICRQCFREYANAIGFVKYRQMAWHFLAQDEKLARPCSSSSP